MEQIKSLPQFSPQDIYRFRNEYLPVCVAASLTGCPYRSLYRFVSTHRLGEYRRGKVYVKFGDLVSYLAARQHREETGTNDAYRWNCKLAAIARRKTGIENHDESIQGTGQ